MKKRKYDRCETECSVEFQLIVAEGREVKDLRLAGTITDICPEGFSLITDYPLAQGHLITIIEPLKREIPRYGVVRWVQREGKLFRAGLSHVPSS